MSCEDKCLLVDLALDGELDAAGIADFERHLQTCADCAVAFARNKALRTALRAQLPRYRAPSGLVQRIREALPDPAEPPTLVEPLVERPVERLAEPEPALVPASDPTKVVSLPARTRGRLAMALAGLGGALAAALATAWIMHVTPEDRMTQAVVESHVRSLMSGHLLDVASDDPKTIRPWFTGRLDVAPPVKDLSADGFELVGARLDYVDNKRAAALIYRHHDRIVTLYVFSTPSAPTFSSDAVVHQGYAVCHWSRRGITDWVVSDLDPEELERFEDLVTGT
ncbi:membrane protein [Aliidongia dinghuensis]|uniref:Membrane protein n=1 Tax=Aliidongia dinghuensis TaxID=1867774 RepID=A0A8J2YZC5_9PROT|nr:zf-HC2 domain-containing protein [Aliidongia dinghuensis]GGF39938.1 membrane protein [Aliidongia dinghuensis]